MGSQITVRSFTSDLPKSEVLQALDRLLDSPQFRTSKKCSRFFRHIVESALDNRLDCLKERTLGVDVFEREPHYDTNQDPIVRGTAGEVRKRLAQYYQESGHQNVYIFGLPSGSYVPEIHPAESIKIEPVVEPPLPISDVLQPEPRPKSYSLVYFSIAATMVLLLIGALLFSGRRQGPLDRFWGPLFSAKQAPIVCIGQPQFYTFRSDTARTLNSWFSSAATQQTGPAPLSTVPLHEIVPMWSEAVALSDCQALLRISSLFAERKKPVSLRGERSASLSDLRGRPAILIGAFNNAWTMNLTGKLRYYFDQDPNTHEQVVRDREHPGQSRWKLVDAWPPTKDIHTDYALVTRVFNATTEETIITLAGISQYGTQAAGEFVTTPEYLGEALAKAPREWGGKNLQIVLSTEVMAGIGGPSEVSGPPHVLAVHFW